jgi:hypothetical protein
MTLKGEELGVDPASRVENGSWQSVDLFAPDPSPKRCFSVYRFVSACLIASGIFVMFTYTLLFVSGFTAVSGGLLNRQAGASSSSSSLPQYFQTTPELYAGDYITSHNARTVQLTMAKVQLQ